MLTECNIIYRLFHINIQGMIIVQLHHFWHLFSIVRPPINSTVKLMPYYNFGHNNTVPPNATA